MVTRIKSAVVLGMDVVLTDVEVGFSRGIPGVTIVGLPDNAVKESKERIKFAIKNSGFPFPSSKIVINLSPADVRKEGSCLDLPMAVALLKNQHLWDDNITLNYLFYGELNLNGELNHAKGVLNMALYAQQSGFQGVVIPYDNGEEASFVKGLRVYACKNLTEVVNLITNPDLFPPYRPARKTPKPPKGKLDFSDIKGQFFLKRVMEIAAAGFHNTLMLGPPGSGKSMISKAMPTILPDMTEQEALETSLIYSAAGLLSNRQSLIFARPFRSPHHTISDVGISGGGKYPVPGEISLAHNGILFLDELPYFKKSALEVLRQPLEDGQITISRSLSSHTYPAKFMLVAAMNPCEDAYGIRKNGYVSCSETQKRHYYSKISKPLLDRIDLQIEVKKLKIDEITSKHRAETSHTVKQRVVSARNRQLDRFRKNGLKDVFANAQMSNREIKEFCPLGNEEENIMKMAIDRFDLSARSYFKILKVARTIADLAGEDRIKTSHLQEALQYRTLNFFKY
jgi:magnesium chelatase family protein